MSKKCPYCDLIHGAVCARIKSIEYHEDGVTVKRVEFHAPQPLMHVTPPPWPTLPPFKVSYGITPTPPISGE